MSNEQGKIATVSKNNPAASSVDLRWEQDAFVLLAALKESVVWELAPSIMDEIRRLVEEFIRRRTANPAQSEKRDEWISVDERLPAGWCWVAIDNVVQRTAARLTTDTKGDCWEWANEDADYAPLKSVSHWQPLPAAPQSGKEGQ